MNTRAKIRTFLEQNFFVPDGALTDTTSLLHAAIVDSTGVLELVAFLEREYGIVVDDAEILPENLDSIAEISAFVGRKLASCVPASEQPPPDSRAYLHSSG